MATLPVTVDAAVSLPLSVQLKEQIRWLVALGDLRPGDRLPTVQELADRLRINRNTVAQVYAELRQEGYLMTRQGQGTFVADSEAVRLAVQKAALGRLVDETLQRALHLGYSPEEFAQAASARAHIQAALRRRRRALFVECNWPEIDVHTRTLVAELGVALDGVHLDEVRRDRDAFRRRAAGVDLVVTTLFHLEEVQRAVGPGVEVIGLGAGLEVQFLRALAQLPRGSKVAIACLDLPRATRVRRMLVNAGVQHLDMTPVGVDDAAGLRRALARMDAVYVSEAAYPEARRVLRETRRLRTYHLALDRAGLEMLKARLAEREGGQTGGRREFRERSRDTR